MIIDQQEIEGLLEASEAPQAAELEAVLRTASECRGLSLEEAAVLLRADGADASRLIEEAASKVKQRVFGQRVVLFAPLYLSSYCTNGCLYCGFRYGADGGTGLEGTKRKALTSEEVAREARSLEARGFKRVLLVTGEDPRWGLDYIMDSVRVVYKESGIRIVHVNAPPMGEEELRELKGSGVGVYQAFQETYHRPTYERVHPSGKKKDFSYRLSVMDRALKSGFDDVGIGALLGLYDYRFDTLATIAHSNHLYSEFGTHAHTISVPRLRPALDSALDAMPYLVLDADMRRITAVYRLAVPSSGVVVSTREPRFLRDELVRIGASQLSAASSTVPGGYTAGDGNSARVIEQFETSDRRSLGEVMAMVADSGFLPSLCTACYRSGRVGANFTETTTAGDMEPLCEANAILTLKEYLLDGRANGSEALFEGTIDKALSKIEDERMRERIEERIRALEEGRRDIYF